MPDPFLTGHVALVTGSSKGLGAEIAGTLAEAGAKVVINAFNNITSEVYALSNAYVAAKGGQTGWSRSMAKELAP